MSIKVPQASFASGELTPELYERTTLDKYRNGLRTGRNVIVGRTGGALSRPARRNYVQTKLDNSAVAIYSPPRTGIFLEWGHQYVRVHTTSGSQLFDTAHNFVAGDIPNLQFETSGTFVYIWCYGKNVKKLNFQTGAFVAGASIFAIPIAPVANSVTATGAPTGYGVDYQVTYIQNGQESFPVTILVGGAIKLPLAAGQSNNINVKISVGVIFTGVTEMRVYRRPTQGGAFGFIGISTQLSVVGADLIGVFEDFGGGADYANTPPTVTSGSAFFAGSDPVTWSGRTGIIYQQRLIQTEMFDEEALLASRPGFQNNFFRDYPLQADSALKFKAGSSGYASVLRLLESDGLVVFTNAGVFLNAGALNVNNLSLDRKGKWVIDPTVAPLAVPGGVFFVDSATNTIRNLVWSTELAGYNGIDVTVYSGHLFVSKKITSWGFQEGNYPLLWVTFDDGTFASFTYQFDQQMQAWTRHDSGVFVETVAQTGIADTMIWVVKKGTKRYIEISVPKLVPYAQIALDPDWDKNPSIAYMDSMISFRSPLAATPVSVDFSISPVTPGDWAGLQNLSCFSGYGPFTNPGPGKPGEILRFFDASDKQIYDLKVITRTDANNLVVQPSQEIPLAYQGISAALKLYWAKATFTGLDHMEGESVSIIADGELVASPNNTEEDFPTVTVVGGSITLPNGAVGALVHIGRPIIGDIETLDVDTVEQAPTLIESLTENKLYISTYKTIGLYVANRFPKDSTNEGMQDLDTYAVDYADDDPIIGNQGKQPSSKRVEATLPGDWKSQGRVALRQVDPFHFTVRSVISDLEILKRSDR